MIEFLTQPVTMPLWVWVVSTIIAGIVSSFFHDVGVRRRMSYDMRHSRRRS